MFPYKDRILQEIEEKRRSKEEELARKRQDAKTTVIAPQDADAGELEDAEEASAASLVGSEDISEGENNDNTNPMAALLASAKARATEYSSKVEAPSDSDSDAMDEDQPLHTKSKTAELSTGAFSHLFPTVLSQADVLLYVLDARDPQSTRSVAIERQIAAAASGTKRLVLILNKIDLVPPPVLKQWLLYLRRYHPTLPLHASNPAPNARTYDHKSLTRAATANALLRALKAYAATQNLKRALSVGVVGFPNVGKSSVINTLVSRLGRSSTAAPVGAEAGVTTALRTVKLDKKLTLIDSPGVIFPSAEEVSVPESNPSHEAARFAAKVQKANPQSSLILLNAVPPKYISDAIPAITLLLARLQQTPSSYEQMLEYYNLPPLAPSAEHKDDVTNDFLVQVARNRGRLGKGGIPNLSSAAKSVLADWWAGRIGGWVDPPQAPSHTNTLAKDMDTHMEDPEERGINPSSTVHGGRQGDEKTIVAEWAKPFVLEGLFGDETDDNGG